MTPRPALALLLPALCTLALLSGMAPPTKEKSKDRERDAGDPARNGKLQLKLDAADRRALDDVLGYTATEFPAGADGLEWVGSSPMSMAALKGKVIVLQSLTTKGSWHASIDPLRKQIDKLSNDVVVIVIHTPEGADKAKPILEKGLGEWMAAIDKEGEYCDQMGIWKKPVNLVIDRQGVVRYGGLTPEGVKAGVQLLLAEKFDPEAPAKPRPTAKESSTVKFPTFTDQLQYSADQRGKQAPSFVVDTWLNGKPELGQKLLVVDFWATWCAPCRAAIPHMNELASKFGTDACFVGISDENKGKFEEGCRKQDLKERDFKYAIALDPQARYKGFFKVTGIPSCVVTSSDGIVRWQGGPQGLTEEVLKSLITANNALNKDRQPKGIRAWKPAADPAKPDPKSEVHGDVRSKPRY